MSSILRRAHDVQAACYYEITADAEAQLLLRIMGIFARNDLVPDRWSSVRMGAHQRIDIQMAFLAHEDGLRLLHRIRNLVGILHADMIH